MAGKKRKREVVVEVIRNQPPKKKQKKNNNKRNRNYLSKKKRPVRMSGMRGRMGTSDFAKSLVDPWNFSSCIPDGARGVGCFSAREPAQLSIGTTGGACCFLWYPNPQAQSFTDSGSTNTTLTISGNTSGAAALSTMDSLYSKFRPVSAGIRASYTGSTNFDAGVLVFAQISGNFPMASLNGATVATLCQYSQYYKIFSLRQGGSITWRPNDMDDVDQFANFGATPLSTTGTKTGSYLVCACFGATATTGIVTIDPVANYEGQYENQSFLGGGTLVGGQSKMAEPGWYETAMNYASSIPAILPYAKTAADLYRSINSSTAALTTPRLPWSSGISIEEVD